MVTYMLVQPILRYQGCQVVDPQIEKASSSCGVKNKLL
jgi:hypothetical protein